MKEAEHIHNNWKKIEFFLSVKSSDMVLSRIDEPKYRVLTKQFQHFNSQKMEAYSLANTWWWVNDAILLYTV